jgi:CarboxypepD_reg-like domain/TonB-dependent Receptor Plug Domain
MKLLFFFTLFLFSSHCLIAQKNTVIYGTITDKATSKPLEGASVTITESNIGTSTDNTGKYTLKNLLPKTYTIIVSNTGYKSQTFFNVILNSGNDYLINAELDKEVKVNDIVKVVGSNKRSAKAATLETPLSVQRLTSEEIKANPGGNFDISRVIQALPGVGGTAGGGSFRNDIIIRGGAPNENVYYLDGIEVPVINHFATQGSAGGPAGILNVSFIEDVKLSSSSFEAKYDNALASVFQFKQKNGNPNRVQGNVRLSATELATTFEGPLSKKTTFLASARRSYLQFLFKAIDLPIRPDYWDFQYKVNTKLNEKTTLTWIGIGAIDEFKFGSIRKADASKLYVLNNAININQWNYTFGVNLKKLIKDGFYNVSFSRNMFNNDLEKYDNNDKSSLANKRTKIVSNEIENKLKFEIVQNKSGYRINYGGMLQYVKYDNNAYQRIKAEVRDNANNIIQPLLAFNFKTAIDFSKIGAFVQVSKRFWDNRLGVNAGIRTDMNTFTTDGMNGLKTLSPRISFSYAINDRWNLNFASGVYYKIPVYPVLGFRDNSNTLVNKNSKYIQNGHLAFGGEFLPSQSTRFTAEVFYKKYNNLAVSTLNGISLSNLGGDFGIVGNEAVTSTGKGETTGFELFYQQKLTKRFFGVFSYTYFNSRYSGANGKLIASAWDNRYLFSATTGYKLKRNWELGVKLRVQGGVPYTPFDNVASQLNFQTRGEGILDYALLNTQRLKAFHSGDIRIDKKWNFKKTTLDFYIDISNFYNAKPPQYPQYTFERITDNSAFKTTDNLPLRQDGSNAIPILLKESDAIPIPTIGFIIEF